MTNKICIAGAGTMGCGIAFCAAQNGFDTILFDTNNNVLLNAKNSVKKNLDFLIEKNKITSEEKSAILQRFIFTVDINDCVAPLIIEAIVEKPEIKISLFNQLAAINESSSIFASNTSSLSINLLQEGIPNPERVAGMHFFNPAQIMKLVEVVKAKQTSDAAIETIMEVCKQMKKTAVLCIDAPGFIVNRVARHYYLGTGNVDSSLILGQHEAGCSHYFSHNCFLKRDNIISIKLEIIIENRPKWLPVPNTITGWHGGRSDG